MLSLDVTQYTINVFQVTGTPAFDYFFNLVFWFGLVAWFLSLPIRLVR